MNTGTTSDLRRALIVCAMESELSGVRERLGFAPAAPLIGRYPMWNAQLGAIELALVQCFVGDANAAIATTAAIQAFRPDIALKLGCVGGHSEGIHAGDFVLPRAYFHAGAWLARAGLTGPATSDAARWVSLFGDAPVQVNRDNLGGRAAVITPDSALTARWQRVRAAAGVVCVPAHIGAGMIWFFERAHMAQVLAAHAPDAPDRAWAADMESYAFAQACDAFGVPFTGLYRASNSEYYGEPYDPGAVVRAFGGDFAENVVRFLRDLQV
jgi:adenosylhomocysteine nucleosidase